MEDVSLDSFEPILLKGIVSDVAVISTLAPFLDKPQFLFKQRDYITTIKFFKLFFEKRGRIPTKAEISLLKDSENKEAILRTFDKVESANYADVNSDLFYQVAERFIKERSIWSTLIEVADSVKAGNVDSSEVLQKFESICSITLDNDGGLDLYENIPTVIDHLTNKSNILSTGFPSIDANIDGGFYAEGRALYMFMAPPNKGKSLFLGNVACNIANQGKTALVISLEMSEAAYGARFCSQQAAIPFSELHLYANELEDMFKNKPGKIIIKEFPPSTLTVAQLKAWIKKNVIEKGQKIDIIIIDYLNLFTGPGSDMYERIKLICEQVRALSYVFNVPVLSATQANRTANGKDMAGLTAVSESSGTAMTADVIMELFQNEEDAVMSFMRVGFAKNRYGPVNKAIITKVNYETLRILDLEEEEKYDGTLTKNIESDLASLV